MTATLTRAVVAGGQVFPVGTPRTGHAAEVVAGPWWSDSGEDAPASEEFDPAKHNQAEVIAHLEGVEDAAEVERILAAEATREAGVRKDIAAWAQARESASSGDGA